MLAGTEIPGAGGGSGVGTMFNATLSPQNESCILMGGVGSHFNVLLTARGKSHKRVSITKAICEEKRRRRRGIEPASVRLATPSHALARPSVTVAMLPYVHRNRTD